MTVSKAKQLLFLCFLRLVPVADLFFVVVLSVVVVVVVVVVAAVSAAVGHVYTGPNAD